ncbi:unnamed protein product [Mycena citricolor]|uniref:Uncharacterized protein n=1 Tax=Mycena citricolor TaxID=2018698 RepID=A0AAD2HVR8_9AGAR|nr:unnamed protein product [Mycena citricolor]
MKWDLPGQCREKMVLDWVFPRGGAQGRAMYGLHPHGLLDPDGRRWQIHRRFLIYIGRGGSAALDGVAIVLRRVSSVPRPRVRVPPVRPVVRPEPRSEAAHRDAQRRAAVRVRAGLRQVVHAQGRAETSPDDIPVLSTGPECETEAETEAGLVSSVVPAPAPAPAPELLWLGRTELSPGGGSGGGIPGEPDLARGLRSTLRVRASSELALALVRPTAAAVRRNELPGIIVHRTTTTDARRRVSAVADTGVPVRRVRAVVRPQPRSEATQDDACGRAPVRVPRMRQDVLAEGRAEATSGGLRVIYAGCARD